MPIPLDEFKDLPEIDPQDTVTGAKVPNSELLEKLSEQAMSTKEVAGFLKIQTGSAHSRLTKLENKGAVTRRQGEAVQYWAANPDYVPDEEDEEEPEDEEIYEDEEEDF
jgi:hypothetical protein